MLVMPTTRNDRVKNHLKDMIERRGTTAYRVAAEIGRKPSTLHDVMTYRRGISDDLLVDLCDYFRCCAGDIIEVLPRDQEGMLPQK